MIRWGNKYISVVPCVAMTMMTRHLPLWFKHRNSICIDEVLILL